ncbi:hypothetical protein NLI96_g5110 [Meripilus lineatus]|uniref:Uncharacterized protein n=1 Tax=Meripilus lineatus TaxID=2056292 RepID=A0AAD5V3M1_9APHY|nr:hypothetical protein NLI96_g5110 [Physisporinus lineatus]
MLRLQSLAAGLQLDSRWLLNNAELSRVRWRKGSHDGELIVEIDCVEAPNRPLNPPYPYSRNTEHSSRIRVNVEDKLELGQISTTTTTTTTKATRTGGMRGQRAADFAANNGGVGVDGYQVPTLNAGRHSTFGVSWLDF